MTQEEKHMPTPEEVADDTGGAEEEGSLGGQIMSSEAADMEEGDSEDTGEQSDFPSLSSEDDEKPWSGDNSGGFNVNLDELSDEELAEFAAENPDGIRDQAKAQASFVRDKQQLKQEREELDRRLEQLEMKVGATSDDGETVSVDVGEGEDEETFELDAERLKSAETVEDFVGILTEEVNQASSRIQSQTRAQIERQNEIERLNRQINNKFDDLKNTYPEVGKDDVRERIEDKMVSEGIRDPEVAYLALLAPEFRKQASRSSTEAATSQERQKAVSGGGAKGGGEGNLGKKDMADASLEERKEAARKFARENPDKFRS